MRLTKFSLSFLPVNRTVTTTKRRDGIVPAGEPFLYNFFFPYNFGFLTEASFCGAEQGT